MNFYLYNRGAETKYSLGIITETTPSVLRCLSSKDKDYTSFLDWYKKAKHREEFKVDDNLSIIAINIHELGKEDDKPGQVMGKKQLILDWKASN